MLGIGSTSGGMQHKKFYPIDKSGDEYFSISASHGTPVYGTAIVENYAGLRSTFFSQRIQVDHTPPVIDDVVIKMQTLQNDVKTKSTRNNETILLQLTASWDVSDDESGIKLCYTFIGETSFESYCLMISCNKIMPNIICNSKCRSCKARTLLSKDE